MYVQPVALSPNTSPWASASGSTATAAIGQIVAMNVVTSMSRRKRFVDDDVADQQQHRDQAEHVALERRVAVGRRAEQHERDAAEREHREHERLRGRCTRRTARRPTGTMRNGASDPISAALATLLCVAPAKKTARLRPKKITRHEDLADVAQRDPPAGAPQHGVPDEADGDHPPERDEDAGRLGALDERRAQRERDDEPDDREHPERLPAQRAHPGGRAGRRPADVGREAHPPTLPPGLRPSPGSGGHVAPERSRVTPTAARWAVASAWTTAGATETRSPAA